MPAETVGGSDMQILVDAITSTPLWVWILFGFLVWRGIDASHPGTTKLWRLAIIPGLLTVWGLHSLVTQFPLGPASILTYLLSMVSGVAGGWIMVGKTSIRADKQKGLIRLPGSWTVLVLVLAIFAVKYAFGYLYATDPALAQHPGFYLSDIGASGLITGAFLGKLARCAALYRAAPHEDLASKPAPVAKDPRPDVAA
jgi:hypothetical protein